MLPWATAQFSCTLNTVLYRGGLFKMYRPYPRKNYLCIHRILTVIPFKIFKVPSKLGKLIPEGVMPEENGLWSNYCVLFPVKKIWIGRCIFVTKFPWCSYPQFWSFTPVNIMEVKRNILYRWYSLLIFGFLLCIHDAQLYVSRKIEIWFCFSGHAINPHLIVSDSNL